MRHAVEKCHFELYIFPNRPRAFPLLIFLFHSYQQSRHSIAIRHEKAACSAAFLRGKGTPPFLQRNGEHQVQAAEHHQRGHGGDQEAAADLAVLLGQCFILMLILPADEKPSGT